MTRAAAALLGVTLLVACSSTNGQETVSDTAVDLEPIVLSGDSQAAGAGETVGWRRDDGLPGNVVEDAGTGLREPATGWGHLRGSVTRVEPWYARVLVIPAGGTTYTDEDWISVEPDDPRVESDAHRVFKVYLDVEHQFGGSADIPDFMVLDGGVSRDGHDLVSTFDGLTDAVFVVLLEPWHLNPAGRPDDRPIYTGFDGRDVIYPVGPDGQINYPGYDNVADLERKAEEPDHVIVVEDLPNGNRKVVDRRPKTS